MSANGVFPMLAILLIGLAVFDVRPSGARAEENCLTAPNTKSPPGKHWYYQTDRAKQRKCWHLGEQGQVVDQAAATAVQGATSKTAPEQIGSRQLQTVQTGPAGLRGSLPAKSIKDGGAVGSQAVPNTAPWPVSASPAPAENAIWPNPPTSDQTGTVATSGALLSTGGVTHRPVAEDSAEEAAKHAGEKPTDEGQSSNANSKALESDFRADRPPVGEVPGSRSEMPTGLIFACAAGLVMAGVFARWMVKTIFGRRRLVHLDRVKTVLDANVAEGRMMPKFNARHRNPKLGITHEDDESTRALRKLLQVIEQQAV